VLDAIDAPACSSKRVAVAAVTTVAALAIAEAAR